MIHLAQLASPSGVRSTFTHLFGKRHDDEWADGWKEFGRMADIIGIPQDWVICPFCGEHQWCFPPHGLGPCPLVISAHETAGLKADAERMMAVRTGVQMEQMGESMQAYMREHGLAEEEEEDAE